MFPAPDAAPGAPALPHSARKPRWGDECEFRFERLDARGNSVGNWGEYTASERGGALGARGRARVIKRRRTLLEVKTLEVLERGPRAANPRCAHSGVCGGCSLQDLEYAAQLEAKAEVAREILRAAGLPAEITQVIACAQPWHYRNKMDFSFGPKAWVERDSATPSPQASGVALGLFPRGFHSKVLEIQECAIAFPGAAAIVNTARRLAREQALDAFDTHTHSGWLRHLLLRRSWASGEIMAVLVTYDESPQRMELLQHSLLGAHPEISTLVQLINTGRALVAKGERERVLHGRGTIRERLCGNEFEIGWGTFFQTNTPQAERLIELVLEAADPRADEAVHDLYCGTGAITLALARRAASTTCAPNVLGVELVESAILAARLAARSNAVPNVRFLAGDVLKVWREAQLAEPASLLVVDPPRAGVHPKVLAALSQARARRIVMVSCQLESGARDAAVLVAAGWRLSRVQALDLFPHTPHLECVLSFDRGA